VFSYIFYSPAFLLAASFSSITRQPSFLVVSVQPLTGFVNTCVFCVHLHNADSSRLLPSAPIQIISSAPPDSHSAANFFEGRTPSVSASVAAAGLSPVATTSALTFPSLPVLTAYNLRFCPWCVRANRLLFTFFASGPTNLMSPSPLDKFRSLRSPKQPSHHYIPLTSVVLQFTCLFLLFPASPFKFDCRRPSSGPRLRGL